MTKFTLVNVICTATLVTTSVVPPMAIAISQAVNAPVVNDYEKIAKDIESDVLSEFFALCEVSRDSYHTRKICDYLKQRFQQYGIPAENIHEDAYRSNWVPGVDVDESESSGNLWIDIPANHKRLKNKKPFALQAHMDMVWETKDEYIGPDHPQPTLDMTDEGRIVHTVNYETSLGADDGAGLALMLAIAKNNEYKHGPLRFIITSDEETGMSGAKYIGCREKPKSDDEFLKNRDPVFKNVKYLLNIDGEKEGEITTSTAGAVISEYSFDLPHESTHPIYDLIFTIDIEGLRGGHSGMSIGDGRLSAVKIAAEVLRRIEKKHNFRIIGINTTTNSVNAIPNGVHVVLALDTLPEKDWKNEISEIHQTIFDEWSYIEPDIKVAGQSYSVKEGDFTCYSHFESEIIMKLLETLYYGVWSWIDAKGGAIETSANIGPIKGGWVKEMTEHGTEEYVCKPFTLGVEARSCNNEHITAIVNDYEKVYQDILLQLNPEDHPNYVMQNQYWGWPGDKDTHLFDTIRESYEKIGVDWNRIDAHAGLEISWFQYIEPSILLSAVGPTLTDVHHPEERFYVDTYASVINAVIRSIDKLQQLK